MTDGVKIRLCRLEECETVLSVWKEANAVPSMTDSIEHLARLVTDHGDTFLVAEENSHIVGTIIAGWDGWRGNLYRLAVLPRYRRQGIASALVREAERVLYSKGARRLSILVEHEDALATTFWASQSVRGYTIDHRMTRYVKSL